MQSRLLAAAVTLTLCLPQSAFAQFTEAWSRIYHMPGGTFGQPVAIAVDDSGNVFVTGTGRHPTQAENVVFLKYTASGDVVNGVAFNGSADSTEVANGVVVDDSGQAYVIGRIYSGPPTGFDYLLIKYGADGTPIWTRNFDGGYDDADYGRDITRRSSGNILVLGQTWDATVLSIGLTEYTPAGEEIWRKTFHWPTTMSDNPRSMDCDNHGNIYVCASSTVALNTNILTVKFDPDGDTLWARQYDGPSGGYDEPVKIAVASDGSVYVAGQSDSTGSDADIVLLKYDSSGNLAWERRQNGSADSTDAASDLELDAAGNPCVAGTWWNDATYLDGVVFKYLADGTLGWLNTGYAFGYAYDDFNGIAVDPNGDVYATGSSINQARSNSDVYTTQFFGETGGGGWEAYYPVDSGGDYGTDICTDHLGNLYVTGYTYSGSAAGFDIVTVKYTPTIAGIHELRNNEIPREFSLEQNYPNPFNARTNIRFHLVVDGSAEFTIFNTLGQQVKIFAEPYLTAGSYVLDWDGRDDRGQGLASGVYFYRLRVDRSSAVRKMVMLK